ncbi:MAG: dienelactone hydrolase family protein [Chthoniobacterales bacterium]|nr:dienelactone hydrolase family protein [Chthoniobacterales bacterium]
MTAVASVKSTLVRRNSSVVVMHLSRWLVWALLGAAGIIRAAEPSFEYDKTVPSDIQQTAQRDDAVALRDISYALGDGRNAATIVESKSPTTEPRAAILFVHWYGPPAPTSNRTQFIPDAVELAKNGAISLLIDTPWSRPGYFRERTREGDYERSVQQVKELRRALDILLAQPNIDAQRVAYVGHDFGAMYGALAAAVDDRVRAFVFMAGTQSFGDWFLYGKPKLEGEARQRFVDELAPLDPVRYLPKLKIPKLLQFADDDEHVSKERADALAAAAQEPKTVRIYHAGHELNDEATRERIEWLKQQLKVPQP